MIKTKKAFTLVELIVVITILSILGTLAFIAFQGYTKNARDSYRLSDFNNLKVAFSIFFSEKSYYPTPSNSFNITYSGGLAWTQGTVGDSVVTNLSNINKKTLDPLYNSEYTYSITKNKNEYQIAGVFEGNQVAKNLFIEKAYASSLLSAKVDGDYNGNMLNVDIGTGTYFLAIPSIITSNNGIIDINSIISQEKLVYNGYMNAPSSYLNTSPDLVFSKGFSYNPLNLIVFSGNLDKNMYINDVISLLNQLKKSYEGSFNSDKFKSNVYGESFYGTSRILTLKFGVKFYKGRLPRTCREMFFINNFTSFIPGEYTFSTNGEISQTAFKAYCLQDSNSEIFTLHPMESTDALHASEMEQKCEEKGLQLFVPRTKEHFEAALSKYGYTYFRLMGVYPTSVGQNCSGLAMKFSGYFSNVDFDSCYGWLPKDKLRYYISNLTTVTEPNGDNNLNASMLYNYNGTTNSLINYNDISNSNFVAVIGGINNNTLLGGYKYNKWICSGKDETLPMYKDDLIQTIDPSLTILNDLDATFYTSCKDIKKHSLSLGDGYYKIKPLSNVIVAYCDMTTNGEARTLYKINQLNSLHASEMEQKCAEEGLQLFVPRTKDHFQNALLKFGNSYFRLMGIYPINKGNICITEHMNFLGDIATATPSMCKSWLPKDGGRYFIEDNLSISEPNGDNDINGSMIYSYNTTTETLTSYNDIVNTNFGGVVGGLNTNTTLGGVKSNRFICSHPDEKNVY